MHKPFPCTSCPCPSFGETRLHPRQRPGKIHLPHKKLLPPLQRRLRARQPGSKPAPRTLRITSYISLLDDEGTLQDSDSDKPPAAARHLLNRKTRKPSHFPHTAQQQWTRRLCNVSWKLRFARRRRLAHNRFRLCANLIFPLSTKRISRYGSGALKQPTRV